MKTGFKNVLALTIITVVAGLLLGFIYEITLQPIADMAAATKKAACQKVFESASSFVSDEAADVTALSETVAAEGINGVDVEEVLIACDASNQPLGHVITAVSHEGYGGDIEISVGISDSGEVLGVEILSISETAGLGMKANTDEFKNQFKNKTVSHFAYTKSGAVQDFEIDALSGATITTKAFTNAVNATIVTANHLGGAN